MNSYNTLDEVREYLAPLGFTEYPPNQFAHRDVVLNFQKRIDDEIGKKYFIDVKVWDWTWTDKIPEQYHIAFETQLYQKDTHDAFNIEFIDWEYEQIVDYIEKMFDNGMLDYYEKWN